MRHLLITIWAAAILSGCSPKITSSFTSHHTPLAKDAEVLVLDMAAPMPENAGVIGQIKIGDTGFTTKNGNYAAVLNIAKDEARKAGGNVVKITEHKSPDMLSSMHRIKAVILRVDDLSVLSDDISDVEISTHPDYAVIYFYRQPGSAPLVVYDVYIGEVKVFESRSRNYAEVKVYDEGEITIWAKTESKEEIPLTVKNGGEYYVRCGTSIGVFIGRPKLEKISNMSGRKEYESLKEK